MIDYKIKRGTPQKPVEYADEWPSRPHVTCYCGNVAAIVYFERLQSAVEPTPVALCAAHALRREVPNA